MKGEGMEINVEEYLEDVEKFSRYILRKSGFRNSFWEEDFLQEGFLGFFEAVEKFDEEKGEFSKFWIYFVKNRIFDFRRKIFGEERTEKGKRKREAIFFPFENCENILSVNGTEEKIVQKDFVEKALALLSEEEKKIFVDWFFHGKNEIWKNGRKMSYGYGWWVRKKCVKKIRDELVEGD